MFDMLSTSFASMDAADRAILARLLDKRNEYLAKTIKLNELKIAALTNPSAANEAAVNDFSTAVIAPLRDAMQDDVRALLQKAVDVDGLQSMLPMILAGALQSVNITLLLTAIGIDPDMISKLVKEIKEYISSAK